MIHSLLEQQDFAIVKYGDIPFIDDSESGSESSERVTVDSLEDLMSIDEAEIDEFDRFYLLSSPEDDAKSIQEEEEIRSFFDKISREKQPLKRTCSLDSFSRKFDFQRKTEKRKRNLSDLHLKPFLPTRQFSGDGQNSARISPEIGGSVSEKIAALNAKICVQRTFSTRLRVGPGIQNQRDRAASCPSLLRNQRGSGDQKWGIKIDAETNTVQNPGVKGIVVPPCKAPGTDISRNEVDVMNTTPNPEKATPISQCLGVFSSEMGATALSEATPRPHCETQIGEKSTCASRLEEVITSEGCVSPSPVDVSDFDGYSHPCLASGKPLGVTTNHIQNLPCTVGSDDSTPVACSTDVLSPESASIEFATGDTSESACENLSTAEEILEAGILADISKAHTRDGVRSVAMHTESETMTVPKSALKHTGSVSKNARVVLNEAKNVYFEANYVIYVNYDEEEFILDLIDDSDLQPHLVAVREFELSVSATAETQSATLSPPDGYKDGLGLETDASLREHPVTTVLEASESDSSDKSDEECLEEAGLPLLRNPLTEEAPVTSLEPLTEAPSPVAMVLEHKQDDLCELLPAPVSIETEMEPPRSILKGGKNWRETVRTPAEKIRFDNCDEKCDEMTEEERKAELKQNSAFQQLFPRAAKRLVHDQDEKTRTSQEADNFKRYEDWRHFMNSRVAQDDGMDDLRPASNPVLRKSIEKNALRRSLVRKPPTDPNETPSSEPVDKLTEKLRWLTDVEENDIGENAYVKMSDVVPEIKHEVDHQMQLQMQMQRLQMQHQIELQHQCHRQTTAVGTKEPMVEEKKKNEKIYKKFNDFFRSKKEKDEKNQKAKVRRSISPPPPSELEPGFMRKQREQMPDVLPRSVENPPQPAKRGDLLTLRVPDDGNSGDSASSGAESYSLDDIEEVLGDPGCTVHHARFIPGEESRDDSGGSRSSRSSGDSGVGVQDSSIDTADGQPKPGEEELALFVQRDAGRTDRLRRRYSITDDDEMEDYGFLRRPSVRGIKPKFGSTSEILKLMHAQLQPPAIATRGANHVSWPHADQSQSDKRRSMGMNQALPSVMEERQMANPQHRIPRTVSQPPPLQRLASSPNLLARPDTCPIETVANVRRAPQSVIPAHHHPGAGRPQSMILQRHPAHPPQMAGQPRPITLAPPHVHQGYALRSPLQHIPEHYSTLPHPLTSSYHAPPTRVPAPQLRGVDDSVIYTTDGRYRPYQHQMPHAYYRPEVSEAQYIPPHDTVSPKDEREGPEGASSSPGLATDVVPNALDYSRKDAAALIPASLALVRP